MNSLSPCPPVLQRFFFIHFILNHVAFIQSNLQRIQILVIKEQSYGDTFCLKVQCVVASSRMDFAEMEYNIHQVSSMFQCIISWN